MRGGPIRLITYLAPSVPMGLFEAVARWFSRETGLATTVASESRYSGPPRGRPDPFSTGEADLAFVCSPAYLWLRELAPPPVELVPFAFAPLDPRAGGRPVYFSDVIVRRGDGARAFDDLHGRTWAYNDTCSMSGYYSLLEKLAEREQGGRFFGRIVEAGSHLRSLALVAAGEADAAAIDSNVLALALARDPALAAAVRVVESWGPFPIQPILARASLDPAIRRAIVAALAALGGDAGVRAELATYGVAGLPPVDESIYLAEGRALAACDALLLPTADAAPAPARRAAPGRAGPAGPADPGATPAVMSATRSYAATLSVDGWKSS
jgi:phosphonate transport system substrate-binding protein